MTPPSPVSFHGIIVPLHLILYFGSERVPLSTGGYAAAHVKRDPLPPPTFPIGTQRVVDPAHICSHEFRLLKCLTFTHTEEIANGYAKQEHRESDEGMVHSVLFVFGADFK